MNVDCSVFISSHPLKNETFFLSFFSKESIFIVGISNAYKNRSHMTWSKPASFHHTSTVVLNDLIHGSYFLAFMIPMMMV